MEAPENSADAPALRKFKSTKTSVCCQNCCHQNEHSKIALLGFILARIVDDAAKIECNLPCAKCNAPLCLGCGQLVTASTSRTSKSTTSGRLLEWHCDEGRLAGIWLLLCGYDHQTRHNKRELSRSVRDKVDSTRKITGQRASKGVGYGGADYGSDMDELAMEELTAEAEAAFLGQDFDSLAFDTPLSEEWMAHPVAQKKKKTTSDLPATTMADIDDELTTRVLEAVTALLPCPEQQQIITKFDPAFDTKPPPILSSILRCSSILDKAAELLRNDSIDDATQRYDLYSATLNFMTSLAKGGVVTTSPLKTPRFVLEHGHDLLQVSFGESIPFSLDSSNTSTPVAACIKNLASQGEVFLKRAMGGKGPREFYDSGSQRMLQLCKEITNTANLLAIACRQDTSTGTTKNPDAWQDDLRVLPVPDDHILEKFAFAKDVHAMANQSMGRMRHIFKEIAVLTTSLPPGIFIRYGESNLAMKVVITGPRETPYENGLFEFDLLCPCDYPEHPPKMLFKTTGGGTVHFNPNLYNCGKVCLSLLGTWHGESWRPGKSTLLQVLVSIQAMIFCADPFCNEPGREFAAGTRISKEFNTRLYLPVVKYAMLEWVEGKRTDHKTPQRTYSLLSPNQETTKTTNAVDTSIGKGDGMWDEVVKKHFETCRTEILGNLVLWVQEKQELDKAEEMRRPPLPFSLEPLPPVSYRLATPAIPKVETEELPPEASLAAFLARAVERMKGRGHPRYPSAFDEW